MRQKHEGKQLSDADYNKAVEKTMTEAKARWKEQEANNKLNPTEKQHGEEQYEKIKQDLAKRADNKARAAAIRGFGI